MEINYENVIGKVGCVSQRKTIEDYDAWYVVLQTAEGRITEYERLIAEHTKNSNARNEEVVSQKNNAVSVSAGN